MKIIKEGTLPEDRPYLKGTCSLCDCEIEVSYNEWRFGRQPNYVKCPTPLCINEICLHLINLPELPY